MLTTIILNVLTLTLEYFDQNQTFKEILLIVNISFSGIYNLEAIIKIIGYGKRYFLDKWNLYDLCASLLHLGANLIEFFPPLIAYQISGIRILRFLKFVHIFRKTRKINIIFQTFIATLPAIINVGSLLLLMFYIFGILS